MSLNLITDRTYEDVARVKQLANKGYANWTAAEKAEWLAGMKGAYNYTDMNRVMSACQTLKTSLESGMGIAVRSLLNVTFSNGTLLEKSYFRTARNIYYYFYNINSIKQAASTFFAGMSDFEESLDGFDFRDANRIESFLLEVEDIINRTCSSANYYMSGEAISGGGI